MIEQPALYLGPWQVLDILAVAAILYQLYRLTRGTAAIRIFLGILAIYLVYQIVDFIASKPDEETNSKTIQTKQNNKRTSHSL